MLVLQRKPGESVVIGEEVEVTVIEIRDGQKVRLGFSAPGEIPIHRKEVWLRIKGEDVLTEPPIES